MSREKDHILVELYVTTNGPLRFAEEDVGMSNAFYAGRGSIRNLTLSSEFNELLGSTPVKTTLNVALKAGDKGLDPFLSEYNWRNKRVKILHGMGTDYSSYSAVFDGILRFPEGLKRNNLRVAIVADDLRSKDSKLIPTELFTEDSDEYKNAPKSTIGKPIPILWGEFAYPLLIKPPCSDASGGGAAEGLEFKIAFTTDETPIKSIGDLYIIEEDESKTKHNWEYTAGSKDLANATFKAGGQHLIKDFSADPKHNGIVGFADDGTYLYVLEDHEDAIGRPWGRLVRTSDGETWTDLTHIGWEDQSPEALGYDNENDILFVSTAGSAGDTLWRSTDQGESWVVVNQAFDSTLIVFQMFRGKMYAGGDRMMYRRDGTDNWTKISYTHTNPAYHTYTKEMASFDDRLWLVIEWTDDSTEEIWMLAMYDTGATFDVSPGPNDNLKDQDDLTTPGAGWLGGLCVTDKDILYTKSDTKLYEADNASVDPGVVCELPATVKFKDAVHDPHRDCCYFVSTSNYIYKLKGTELTVYSYTGVGPIYRFGLYTIWARTVQKIYCNSQITNDAIELGELKQEKDFAIEASGRYKSGGGDPLIDEPTDVYTNILKADLGVADANIHAASILIVKNILTNSGAGEFKVHRYLTKQIQAMELISELCAECEIMPSVRVSKYYLQYMWPSGSSGATFHSKVFRDQHIRDKVFETTDCPDYFNKFSMLHKHDPCTGNFEGTEIQLDGAAQATDGVTVAKDLSCLWRYNGGELPGDSDHISVKTLVSNLISFFAANPEWVSTTLKDTLDIELGDVVRLEIGHLSNVPVLVRSIRKDFLAKHTHIEGWNLRTAGDYSDSFWRLRDGEEINPTNYPALEKVYPGIPVALHGWYMHMRCMARRVHFMFKITGDFTTIESNSFYCPSNGGKDYDVTLGAAINGIPDGTYATVEIWAAAIVPEVARIWDAVFDMSGGG